MFKCNNDNQINTGRSNDSKELKKILLKDYQKRWDYQKINNYKNTIIEGKFKFCAFNETLSLEASGLTHKNPFFLTVP